jgi:hypothetical protein
MPEGYQRPSRQLLKKSGDLGIVQIKVETRYAQYRKTASPDVFNSCVKMKNLQEKAVSQLKTKCVAELIMPTIFLHIYISKFLFHFHEAPRFLQTYLKSKAWMKN